MDRLQSIFKATWLIALALPQLSIRAKDLAKILSMSEQDVKNVLNKTFLNENKEMILKARKEIEASLQESGISVSPIMREGYLPNRDYILEIQATFLDYRQVEEWEALYWNDGQGEDSDIVAFN